MSSLSRRKFLQHAGWAAGALPAAAMVPPPVGAASKRRIRIGQIGTGHAHAAGKLRTIQSLSEHYELVGVVENDPERRQRLGDTYHGVELISEEKLFNTPGLQAVAVETEVRELVPTAARCVQAGLHIHLDKPAGESFQAYESLLDEASRRKLTVQMGYIYRYHPAFRFCIRALRDGWLGEVFEVDGVISKTVGAASRKRLAEYAGGAMFELGCHLIDVLVWILGEPDGITPFIRRSRPEEDSLADNQLAVFEYPEATATIRSALIEVAGARRRQFVVCGDQGTFDLRPLSGGSFRLALDRPRGPYRKGYQEVTLPEQPRRYVGDFLDLAALIRGEKETEFSVEHDLAVHRAILLASGYDT
ncbi:MAG: Gfo/Idh/MocA family protein [Planctomycetota bacterium]